jgi:EAL domain-containing protein (putative c-di-GMP-specific phosphodiesterase class I)
MLNVTANFLTMDRFTAHDGRLAEGIFFPLAEESCLIISNGEWGLREARREAASSPIQLQTAVDLSPIQFRRGDLVRLVYSVLLETGLSSQRLELTEGGRPDLISRLSN